MKSRSSASIVAASFVSIVLLAPVHQAMAAKGGNAGAATQTQVGAGMQNGSAGKLTCTGSGCPGARANEVRATTTGTYKERRCLPGSGGMCRK